MQIVIILNERDIPIGKLADAELHFDTRDGLLDGLKLQGFAIWESRWPGKGGGPNLNVTYPARAYTVNGEQRTWTYLRSIEGSPVRGAENAALEPLKQAIVEAYLALVRPKVTPKPAPKPAPKPTATPPVAATPARPNAVNRQHWTDRTGTNDDYPF